MNDPSRDNPNPASDREQAPNEVTLDDLKPGEIRKVMVGDQHVAVVNVEGELYAVSDTCTHASVPLSGGWLGGHLIVCPWHYAMFDVRSGAVHGGPACDGLRCYRVTIEGKKAVVTDEPPLKPHER